MTHRCGGLISDCSQLSAWLLWQERLLMPPPPATGLAFLQLKSSKANQGEENKFSGGRLLSVP